MNSIQFRAQSFLPWLPVVFFALFVFMQVASATDISKTAPIPQDLVYEISAFTERRIPEARSWLREEIEKNNMTLIPMEIHYLLVPVHIWATSEDFKKQIYVLVGARVEKKFRDRLFSVKGIRVYHLQKDGLPLAIAFEGFDDPSILQFINSLSKEKESFAQTPSVLKRIFSEQFPEALATVNEVRLGTPSSNNTAVESPTVAALKQFSRNMWGCVVGVNQAFNSVAIDPFVNFVKNDLILRIKHPDQYLLLVAERRRRVEELLNHPIGTMQKKFASMTEAEKAGLWCSLGLPGMATTYLGRAAGMAASLDSVGTIARSEKVLDMAQTLENEQQGLALASKLGFNVSGRIKALRAIDNDVKDFAREVANNTVGASRFNAAANENIVARLVQESLAAFKKSIRPRQTFNPTELASFRLRYFQTLRAEGDYNLMRVLLPLKPEDYLEYYGAWFHRTVTSGERSLAGGDFAFVPGPDGSLKIVGFSNYRATPAEALAAATSHPLKILSTEIFQQPSTYDPLRFEAVVSAP